MAAEIAYVASHGTNLAFPSDINQIPESKLSPTFSQANTPYPQFGTIQGNLGESVSNYNSLQIQFNAGLHGG